MLLVKFRVTEFRSVQDMVKREILKGTDKVICESDPEFAKILELFNRFS